MVLNVIVNIQKISMARCMLYFILGVMLGIGTFSCKASGVDVSNSNNIKQKTKKDTRLKMENLIKSDLIVKQKNHDIEAIVTFINTGNKIAYIWEENAPLNRQPSRSLFEISCENNKISYSGIMAKMRVPTIDDFIKIQPEDKYTFSVLLNKYYKFHKGEYVCNIKYIGFNPISEQLIGYDKIESNTVTIKIEQ